MSTLAHGYPQSLLKHRQLTRSVQFSPGRCFSHTNCAEPRKQISKQTKKAFPTELFKISLDRFELAVQPRCAQKRSRKERENVKTSQYSAWCQTPKKIRDVVLLRVFHAHEPHLVPVSYYFHLWAAIDKVWHIWNGQVNDITRSCFRPSSVCGKLKMSLGRGTTIWDLVKSKKIHCWLKPLSRFSSTCCCGM